MLIYGQSTIANPSSNISAYVSQDIFGIAKNDGQQIKDRPASLSRKSPLGNSLIFGHHEEYSLHILP